MTTNNILTTSSTLDSMIGKFRAHVLGRCLPVPALVQFFVSTQEVAIQPGGLDVARCLDNILTWAHTLTGAYVTLSRIDDRLHVSMRGHTPGGLRIMVYGGGTWQNCLDQMNWALDDLDDAAPASAIVFFLTVLLLAPDHTSDISLDELRTLAELLHAAEPERP